MPKTCCRGKQVKICWNPFCRNAFSGNIFQPGLPIIHVLKQNWFLIPSCLLQIYTKFFQKPMSFSYSDGDKPVSNIKNG